VTYLVLARKWRPRRFSEVVGQEHVTLTLKKAVEKKRLAHAYLFAGPRGCGKTTTARILAKVINCENPDGSEPCNECASCRAVNEGRHLDVIEIDGASNRGIDEIRDLREKIGYAPSQGKSKIYIIDEVHMLTPQAFNALLKTLEEPPAHVYLIFATTEPQKVPATILSRCQRFNFKRLELGELVGQLEKICRSEKIEYEKDALILISRSAEGSMRDAESLLDQCISASEGGIDLELVRRVLGLVDEGVVIELLSAIVERDRRKVLEVVDRVVSSGLDIEEFFLSYAEGLRNLLVLSVAGGKGKGMVDLTSDEIDSLEKVAKGLKTEDLLYLLRHAIKVYRDLKNSSQPRYLLEAAFTEAASWENSVEISEILRRIGGNGGVGSSGGGATAARPHGIGESSGTDGGTASFKGQAPGSTRVSGNTGDADVENGTVVSPGAGSAAMADVPAGGDRNGSGPGEGSFARINGKPEVLTPESDEETIALSSLGGKDNWEKFLSKIREAKLTLGIWLMSAKVVGVEQDSLILGFAPQNRFAREMVFEEKNKRYIENHLEKFFGRRLVLRASDSQDAVAAGIDEKKKKTAKIDKELNGVLKNEPVIKRVIQEFDGELFRKNSQ